jgi:hypothetical protein
MVAGLTLAQQNRIADRHAQAQIRVFVGGARALSTAIAQAAATATNTGAATTTATNQTDRTLLAVGSTAGFETPASADSPEWVQVGGVVNLLASYTGLTATEFTGIAWYRAGLNGLQQVASPDTVVGGTPVTQWLNITDLVTRLSIGMRKGENDSLCLASGTIAGHNYAMHLIQADAALVVQASFDAGATWEDVYRGYVAKRPDLSYNGMAAAGWRTEVEGTTLYLRKRPMPSQSYGLTNLAHGKTVGVSSTLADVLTLITQGEGLAPTSASGSNLVDGTRYTVWSSQTVPNISSPTTGSGLVIQGVYMRPYTGQPYSTRQLQWVHIYNGLSTPVPVLELALGREGVEAGNRWWDSDYNIRLHAISRGEVLNPGKHLIVCYDKAIFTRTWAVSNDTIILEYKQLHPNWQWHATSGMVWLFRWMPNTRGYVEDALHYGAEAAHDNPYYYNPGAGAVNQAAATIWSGAPKAAPAAGQGLQRSQLANDSNAAGDWTASDAMQPGHPPYSPTNAGYAIIDLGEFVAATTQNAVNNGTSPATIALDPAGVTTENYTPAGQIRLGAGPDVFAYTGKTATSFTGVTGSATTTYAAGSVITQVVGGVAANLYHVGQVVLKRWKENSDAASITFPQFYSIRTTPNSAVTDPADVLSNLNPGVPSPTDAWVTQVQVDWAQPVFNADKTLITFKHTLPSAVRARHVALVVLRQTDSTNLVTGQVRVNEIEVYPANATASSNLTLQNTATIARDLLLDSGLVATSEITLTGSGQGVSALPLAHGSALDQAADVLRLGRGVLVADFLNKIAIEDDPWMPAISYPATVFDWDASTIAAPLSVTGRPTHTVAQVRLTARSISDSEEYTVYHPPVQRAIGTIVTINGVMAGSIDLARFLALYLDARLNRGWQFTVRCPGIGWGLLPMQRYTLTAYVEREDRAFVQMNVLCTAVRHEIQVVQSGVTWVTEIDCEEYPIL